MATVHLTRETAEEIGRLSPPEKLALSAQLLEEAREEGRRAASDLLEFIRSHPMVLPEGMDIVQMIREDRDR